MLRYRKPLAAVTVVELVFSLVLGMALFTGPVEAAGEGRELTREELNWFRNSFFYGPETPITDGAPPFAQGFANHFLGQSFRGPEELDLSLLFYDGSGSAYQMDQTELDQLATLDGFDGRPLAGYQVEEGYWLYLYQEATVTISFLQARQNGAEILFDEPVSLQAF